jgi:hypothetical protein
VTRRDRFYGAVLAWSLFGIQYAAMLKKRRVSRLTQLRRRFR